jgi:serine/threonine protein kinase
MIVPRSRTQANLTPLGDNPNAFHRSKTFPDPFRTRPKFTVADPLRRDRQIQILEEEVKFEHLYDIGSLIGSGGFGKVKDSIHPSTFKPYAVKVVQKTTIGGTKKATEMDEASAGKSEKATELTEANFRDIMEFLMNQRHPYMVTIERVFEDASCYYVVMPRCTGGDLRKHIHALQDEQKCIDEDKLREIVRMLVAALRFLHSMSRIHRDVKPENVLYETEIGQVVKLADFDMCCACPEAVGVVVGSSIVGTLGYLAPEVLSMKQYSRQSDMFALGVLMHFCETLSPPKEMVSARDVTAWCESTQKRLAEGSGACAGSSEPLRQAIGTLLSPSPHLRPAHLDMFVECVWLCGSGVHQKKTSPKSSKISLPRPDSFNSLLKHFDDA